MYAKLVNNLDALGFTDITTYLPQYLNKTVKEGTSVQDALIHLTDRDFKEMNVLHKYKLVYHTFPILKQRMNMTIVFNQM